MLYFIVGFPLAVGILVCFLGRIREDIRDKCAVGAALIELLAAALCLAGVVNGQGMAASLPDVCGLGMHLELDGFRAIYVVVAAFMWAVSIIFSTEYMRTYRKCSRYYFFLLVTLGATVGVFLSADLFTTFVFFEIMSFASYVWVAQDEKKESLRAAETYLAVAVIGGLVMLMGLFLVWNDTGTLMIRELPQASITMTNERRWAAGLCMLFGFGAKAGAFPLHIWLPKAHPVAPAPASALLSGILTKTGIFGILVLSLWMFAGYLQWGALILALGTVTMVLGAVLALFSINLKRTLACSSVSQIGFILVGVGSAVLLGTDNDLAVKGSLLHMINHSLIKLVLFSAAGVVYMNIHRLELNEIRGFGRRKPFLAAIFLAGAWSIAGIPLGSGYVSKTLLHEGLVELIGYGGIAGTEAMLLRVVEWLFLISGGLTLAYMTKLFVAIFIEKNEDAAVQADYESRRTYMNLSSAIALGAATVLLPVMGLLPGMIMDGMADLGREFLGHSSVLHRIRYYSLGNLKGALISIVIGILCYAVVVARWMKKDGRYVNRWNDNWDLETQFYRPLIAGLVFAFSVIMRFCDRLLDSLVVGLRRTAYKDSPLPHELEEGTVVTHVMGVLMDDGKEVLNHTIYKKNPLRVSFEHKLAMLQSVLSENNTIIARSLSFGLLLVCVGLILTLLYMLL